MADRQTVFLPEFVSEDTNHWDGRTRYQLSSTFEGATESMKWATEDSDEGKWVELEDLYGGGNAKNARKWCEHRYEDGEFYDEGDGYGFYIWEEYVD